MIDRYTQICRAVEEEFSRNRRLYGERIHCQRGCDQCCSQLFQITEVEAGVISLGVAGMAEAERTALQERARTYIEERRELVAKVGMQEAWGSLPPAGTRLPCPALVDGGCSIYEYRPLICRKFGIPLYNPDKPGRVFACELNFKDGEGIDDGELVQIQSGIHEAWKQVQRDYNEGGGYRDAEPITVARAIAEDFRWLVS